MIISTKLTLSTLSVKDGVKRLRSLYNLKRLGSGSMTNGLLSVNAHIEVTDEEVERVLYYKSRLKTPLQTPIPHKLPHLKLQYRAKFGKPMPRNISLMISSIWEPLSVIPEAPASI